MTLGALSRWIPGGIVPLSQQHMEGRRTVQWQERCGGAGESDLSASLRSSHTVAKPFLLVQPMDLWVLGHMEKSVH